ncbi:MAG: GNAT family N-acetyltransferase [archaeon]
MTTTIRLATKEDLDQLVELCTITRKHHEQFGPEYALAEGWQLTWRNYASSIIEKSQENSAIYVADIEGRLVGYCMGNIQGRPPVFQMSKEAYISDVLVRPEYRRQGIGEDLVNAMILHFKDKADIITLKYAVDNDAARGLYEKLGFAPTMEAVQRRLRD